MSFIQAKITNITETKTDGVLSAITFIVDIKDDRFPVEDNQIRTIERSLSGEDINHINEGVFTLAGIIETHISWMRTDIDKEFIVIPTITTIITDTPEKIGAKIG